MHPLVGDSVTRLDTFQAALAIPNGSNGDNALTGRRQSLTHILESLAQSTKIGNPFLVGWVCGKSTARILSTCLDIGQKPDGKPRHKLLMEVQLHNSARTVSAATIRSHPDEIVYIRESQIYSLRK